MRDIYLFRAKGIEIQRWVYGYLCFIYVDGRNENGYIYTNKARIYSQEDCCNYDVYSNTLCGLVKTLDNGEKLWEGDIVNCKHKSGIEFFGEVVFDETALAFGIKTFSKKFNSFIFRPFYEYEFSDIKILGNKIDNPELLEGENNV